MNSNVVEFLVILVVGSLVYVGAYVALSNSAGVLFGFVYLTFIPVLHKGFGFFERAAGSTE